jgi:hypothetical protein
VDGGNGLVYGFNDTVVRLWLPRNASEGFFVSGLNDGFGDAAKTLKILNARTVFVRVRVCMCVHVCA